MKDYWKNVQELIWWLRLWKTTDDVYYIPMHQPLPWKQAIVTACQGSCYEELLQPEEISAKQSVLAYCVTEWSPCPNFFFFCWKCSSSQHETYTCHELMHYSCQGLHLGSINRVKETFQGSMLMLNPLFTKSPLHPREESTTCQTTTRMFKILLF